jgi:hypothetical protein
VLELLARYHRHFADQWEFVAYVRQHKLDLDLDLDLTTPRLGAPRRLLPHRHADA